MFDDDGYLLPMAREEAEKTLDEGGKRWSNDVNGETKICFSGEDAAVDAAVDGPVARIILMYLYL